MNMKVVITFDIPVVGETASLLTEDKLSAVAEMFAKMMTDGIHSHSVNSVSAKIVDRDPLKQIAGQFVGIQHNELSTAERNIFNVLKEEGYVTVKDGTVEWMPAK